jgi:hypothetical protein
VGPRPGPGRSRSARDVARINDVTKHRGLFVAEVVANCKDTAVNRYTWPGIIKPHIVEKPIMMKDLLHLCKTSRFPCVQSIPGSVLGRSLLGQSWVSPGSVSPGSVTPPHSPNPPGHVTNTGQKTWPREPPSSPKWPTFFSPEAPRPPAAGQKNKSSPPPPPDSGPPCPQGALAGTPQAGKRAPQS